MHTPRSQRWQFLRLVFPRDWSRTILFFWLNPRKTATDTNFWLLIYTEMPCGIIIQLNQFLMLLQWTLFIIWVFHPFCISTALLENFIETAMMDLFPTVTKWFSCIIMRHNHTPAQGIKYLSQRGGLKSLSPRDRVWLWHYYMAELIYANFNICIIILKRKFEQNLQNQHFHKAQEVWP